MVSVTLDRDEWYPVFTYSRAQYARDEVNMTNTEFVQFVMALARWERWQSELAQRANYWK